ncbi:unnamed protein product [Protopolystoma xenopodis]|uniref:ditrans,polycis-polyprenyl diphosphate synthase [(2E,6E)-farnesyldiphosphate specific] n=1 Tax=Protopolystoma xenopodis TaxID=117903 RepID=A0A448WZ82_9PLAT|nr:unnamed protein product [Protopolystoma xenopodis]
MVTANFKRSKDEVNFLMDLAKTRILELLKQSDSLEKEGICIRIIGNLGMLPTDLRQMAAEVMLRTRNFIKYILLIRTN